MVKTYKPQQGFLSRGVKRTKKTRKERPLPFLPASIHRQSAGTKFAVAFSDNVLFFCVFYASFIDNYIFNGSNVCGRVMTS